MSDLLFIRPADDRAAQLTSAIGGRLLRRVQYNACSIPAWTTTDLAGAMNATRANIDSKLRNGDHLLYFGHGAISGLMGNGSTLVDSTNIASLLRSAIVVAVACYSLEGLGVTSTRNGHVAAYLGWADELPIPHANPNPMVDALCNGLIPLFQGRDLQTTRDALNDYLANAVECYQQWLPPTTAGAGAALFAKMASAFASYCLGIKGAPTATL